MKLRTITLTDRAPVVIDEQEWPLIVEAQRGYPGESKPACMPVPPHFVKLKLRRHESGRVIVYGTRADNGEKDESTRRGYYLLTECDPTQEIKHPLAQAPSPDRVVATIRQVADELGAEDLGQVCIAMLPAERI